MGVYSIWLWCVSVIFGGGLLLSFFSVTFWCAFIGGIVVFCGRCCVGCLGHVVREFGERYASVRGV